jgi:hypothetical protein
LFSSVSSTIEIIDEIILQFFRSNSVAQLGATLHYGSLGNISFYFHSIKLYIEKKAKRRKGKKKGPTL